MHIEALRFSSGSTRGVRVQWRTKFGATGSKRVRDRLLPSQINLLEDSVHDPGGKQNLPVRYRQWRVTKDRPVERLDQIFHARLHVEIPCQKQAHVSGQIPEVFL